MFVNIALESLKKNEKFSMFYGLLFISHTKQTEQTTNKLDTKIKLGPSDKERRTKFIRNFESCQPEYINQTLQMCY